MSKRRLTELNDEIFIADGGPGEQKRCETPLPRQLTIVVVEVCHLLDRRIVRFLV